MKPLSNEIRASIIQLAKVGKSSYQIANALDIHFTTAAKIVREEVMRRPDLNRRPAGRPRILSKREERKIVTLMTSGQCKNSTDVRKFFKEEYNRELTADTVRRVIQREEVLTRVLPKKPLLSAAHRRRPLEFARKHINWTVEDWKRVMFSDETKLTFTNLTGKQYYYKRKGEPLRSRHIQPTMKQTGNGVMAWSCVTDHGVGNLHRIDGALNAALYFTILSEDYLGSLKHYGINKSRVIFQHDNDPKHTAKVTKEWLNNNGISVLEWPPQSPDLNIIEHVWGELKRKLSNYSKMPRNKDEIWERAEKEWKEIEPEYINKLYASTPERIRAAVSAKGGHTKYYTPVNQYFSFSLG
ncbi:uncharacterized protein VTP21DRAFT_6210 [Calcarisporiella thermophila]|uniref:uncharacterized protein n=1 Tax=Calcarisporiella thermophila TaxID=911321 RepID=UPI0037423992